MSGPVLILTGPPGSGKTTVARTLAARRDQAAHVESDEFFRFVRAGFVAPWLPRAHRQNEVVMRAVAESAAAYAQGGYFTIVDGIISPRWFFAPLRDAMSARGIEVAYTILRPSAATAIARASSRAASAS